MMQNTIFKNKKLFEQAFIHRSYLNEAKPAPRSQGGVKIESNERLEFLGDSILSFVVSDFLYKTYPQFNEGVLTNIRSLLVNTKILAGTAKKLGFGQLLKLSKGEEESKGRENLSLLADCFEAFIGALFLDQGIEAVSLFLEKTLLPTLTTLLEKKSFKDPKSLLQEHVQSHKQNSPHYKVIKEEGPAHAKKFTIGVYIGETLGGQGQGKSKQEAEENAAQIALDTLTLKQLLEKKKK